MRASSASVAAALLLAAQVARADAPPPPPQPSPEHEAAFKSGLAHFEQQDYVGAIQTWESLLATMGEERGYKVLYNLGLAYEAIGDVTHAIERFRAFDRQVGQRDDKTPDLEARAADARMRAGQLEATHGAVYVDAPRRGGVVLTRVGTADPRAAGYVVWLAPGRHEVEIFVGTNRARLVPVDVEAAKAVHVDTTPPEEPAPPPPPPPEPPSSTLLWIGAGATIASVALPVSLFFVARGKRDDAESLGAGATSYADARSTYTTWRTVYYASYALPAALGIATGVAYLLRSTPSTTVGVSPGGVSVAGRF